MAITLTTAQRLLLGIITSVEAGVTTPEEGIKELDSLKKTAPEGFKADYTLEDFQRIRQNYAQEFESSTAVVEDVEDVSSSYVPSTSY